MMTEKDVKKIFVVGAGTMGSGLAQSYAQAGYTVSLYSRSQETLDRAKEYINAGLHTLAQENMVDGNQIPAIMGRISYTRSVEEGSQNVDIAVETVVENVEVKKDMYKQLDRFCPPRALIASNTSFLNIFEFAETSRPDKILIAHWYSPPHLMPFVEVVKGPQTDNANVELMAAVLRKMGKKPAVLQKFIPGFIINRLQIAFQRECHYLVDNDYISPADLDEAAKWGLALRMLILGIYKRMDFGGIDITVNNLKNPGIDPVPLDYMPKKVFELAEQGHLGLKTGKGWYDYSDKSKTEYLRERDLGLIKILKAFQ